MSVAFVLISADLGSERRVVGELGRIECVGEAHVAYGAYDVIAKWRQRLRRRSKISSSLRYPCWTT